MTLDRDQVDPDLPPAEAVAPVPRLSLRPAEAARALGISPRKLWEISAGPDGPPKVKIGGAVLYPCRELANWLRERAESEGEQ